MKILFKEYESSNWPSKERLNELSKLTNLRVTIVQRWFKNKFYTHRKRLLNEKR